MSRAHDLMPAIDRYVDELLAFENVERYTPQSANTVDGKVAPLPPRPKLRLFVFDNNNRKTD